MIAKMTILLIDNHDSFVYNLGRYIEILGYTIRIARNNDPYLQTINTQSYSHIVLSPGPGGPLDGGYCLDIVKKYSGTIPILGICLGHQIIAQAFGGNIVRAQVPMHGLQSRVRCLDSDISALLTAPFMVGRYHSLIVCPKSIPHCLRVTMVSEEQEIMAFQHKTHPTIGLQFHPESILTPAGLTLLKHLLRVGI